MANIKKNLQTLEGEEIFYLSLTEVTFTFGVEPESILEIINEGIVSVQINEQNEWQFDTEAFRRIRTVFRLQKDLGVNLEGAALALELLDEIGRLQTCLHLDK